MKAEDLIIADSAEQKSINELRDRDWCRIPISKGAVNAEISRLSKWRVNVIESPNISRRSTAVLLGARPHDGSGHKQAD